MRWIFVLILTVLVAAPARAETPDEGVQAVIQAQIAAFSQQDFPQAFSYASPGIQRLFGSVQRFEWMVRHGYAMVIAPREVEFLRLEGRGGIWRQGVRITDTEGGEHLLVYEVLLLDGIWRIDGVFLAQAPDIAT